MNKLIFIFTFISYYFYIFIFILTFYFYFFIFIFTFIYFTLLNKSTLSVKNSRYIPSIFMAKSFPKS